MLSWRWAVAFDRSSTSIKTRDAMAVKRGAGHGVGLPTVEDNKKLAGEICALRDQGREYQEIAALLNERGEPTVRGGKEWRPSSIQTVIRHHREASGSAGRRAPPDPPTIVDVGGIPALITNILLTLYLISHGPG